MPVSVAHLKGKIGSYEERHDFHSSPNTIQVIKSRRMRLAGCVAQMGDAYKVCWGNLKEVDGFVHLGLNGRKIAL
jgi:hypothetical protein